MRHLQAALFAVWMFQGLMFQGGPRESSKNVELGVDDGTDLVKCLIQSQRLPFAIHRVCIGCMFELRGILHNFRGPRFLQMFSQCRF